MARVRGLDEGTGATTMRLGWIVVAVVVLMAAIAAVWYVVKHPEAVRETTNALTQGDLPPWMARKAKYEQDATPATNHVVEDPQAKRWADLMRRLGLMEASIEELKRRPQHSYTYKAPEQQKAAEKPPAKQRAPMLYVVNEQKPPAVQHAAHFRLTPGTWIPCTVEPTLNSEIEGYFTVKTKRVVADSATGAFVLIPQGQSIVAKDTTGDLLFGNERIPTFALTMSPPNGVGPDIELGQAPIVDATGTNGLTGRVDNHVWRLVWTSIFIGGLRGGQQVVQQAVADAAGVGPVAGSILGQGSQVSQQRLGRAQDTRPTITVDAGAACNILVTKGLSLPMVALAR